MSDFSESLTSNIFTLFIYFNLDNSDLVFSNLFEPIKSPGSKDNFDLIVLSLVILLPTISILFTKIGFSNFWLNTILIPPSGSLKTS